VLLDSNRVKSPGTALKGVQKPVPVRGESGASEPAISPEERAPAADVGSSATAAVA
jgi:hypothetical protein